jgi:hypothetical protein
MIIRKGKVVIIEGSTSVKFFYTIDPWALRCQCLARPGQTLSYRTICKHLEWYFVKYLGFKPQYLPILRVPSVKDWCQSNSPTADTLDRYCRQYLESDTDGHGCGICLSPLVNPHKLCQCGCCYELFHEVCSIKWDKGCPKCRGTAPLARV